MRPEIYKDEGYKLMGAAFEVYKERGPGVSEEIYQECMAIELSLRGIPFRSKSEVLCYYKGHQLNKRYYPDFTVFGSLIAELKAVSELIPEHEAQLLNYLHLTQQPVGYLINFGRRGGLEWQRLIISEYIPTLP